MRLDTGLKKRILFGDVRKNDRRPSCNSRVQGRTEDPPTSQKMHLFGQDGQGREGEPKIQKKKKDR